MSGSTDRPLPIGLALRLSGTRLYATSEMVGWNEGTISAYAIDPRSDVLSYLNEEPTRGDIAAHCDVDVSGHFAAVANSCSGAEGSHPDQSVALFPLAADGSLLPAVSQARHRSEGVNVRQERARPLRSLEPGQPPYGGAPDQTAALKLLIEAGQEISARSVVRE